MDHGVVVDHRTGFDGFQLLRIKLLDVSCLQPLKGVPLLAEVRLKGGFDHRLIGAVGGRFHTHLDDVQPLQKILRKGHVGSKLSHLLRRLKLTADTGQRRLRFSLVSLFRKSCGYILDVPLISVIVVAEHHIVVSFLDL